MYPRLLFLRVLPFPFLNTFVTLDTADCLKDFTYTNLLLTFEHLTEISEWIDKCLSNESEQSTDAKTWVAQFLTYWIRCLSIGYVHEKILISP